MYSMFGPHHRVFETPREGKVVVFRLEHFENYHIAVSRCGKIFRHTDMFPNKDELYQHLADDYGLKNVAVAF